MSVVNYLKKVQLPNNTEYTVKDPTFFTGTTEEWNLLSTEEKQSYQIVNLTDDFDEALPIWTKATTIYSKTLSKTSDAYGLMQIKSNDTDLPSNAVIINTFATNAYLFGNRIYSNKIECVLCSRDLSILANATVDITVLYILR